MASKVDVADAERKQDLAWKLHLAGATPQEIAASKDPVGGKPLFKDARGAAQALRAARRRYEADDPEPTPVTDFVSDEVRRLRRIERALWPAATSGDVAAARECRQIGMTIANLLGYGKGVEVPSSQGGDPVDELTAKRAARRAAHG
jgi:hypothetical protein